MILLIKTEMYVASELKYSLRTNLLDDTSHLTNPDTFNFLDKGTKFPVSLDIYGTGEFELLWSLNLIRRLSMIMKVLE